MITDQERLILMIKMMHASGRWFTCDKKHN